ncbi:hypothetical protein C8J57DRAFT_1065726, partial [Mycena rebaudengoi]
LRCWVKTLADLHGLAFKPYRAQQFTICFDLYLEICQQVHLHVLKALGRDALDCRLKTGCVACTYKLEGEADLIFSMLVTMDGNDLLKRILRKEKAIFLRAKYPLAMVDALLDAFGPDLGGGYDIGCGFGTTIRNSPLGPQAKAMNFKCLVGVFHGVRETAASVWKTVFQN